MQLPTDHAPTRPSSQTPDSFGARLRHERERRKISISSIAENTKILGALLEGLENDDVSRWPTGFYRRAFIRAYAVAIGLDPEPVVREFGQRFPDPEDTLIVSPPPPAAAAPAPLRPVRLTVVGERSTFSQGTVLDRLRARFNAIAVDAFVLGVTGLAMFLVLGQFWAPLTIAIASYYFLSILLLGNTPGVTLFAPRDN
jgi:cytoskeletal protein RodZ